MTLPLKLAAFERYALGEFANPMTYTIRLCCRGRLDEGAFRTAVEQALERQPLLRACATPESGQWFPAPQSQPWLQMTRAGEPFRYPAEERIDLAREAGLRIWVQPGQPTEGGDHDGDHDGVEFRFQFHHACCDGIGAYAFLAEVFAHYDRLTRPGSQVEPPPLDDALLLERERFGLSWSRLLCRLPLEALGIIVGLGGALLVRPVTAAASQTPPCDAELLRTHVRMPAITFGKAALESWRETARAAGATLNDLLLCALFAALQQWNVEHDAPSKLIRLTLPMNLRVAGQERMPAANVVGMTFIDRNPRNFRSAGLLLKTINWEMRVQKAGRFALTSVRFCQFPWCMRIVTRPGRPAGTAVLSNMGRLFADSPLIQGDGKLRSGELTVERVESAPPVMPQIDLSFSALSYAGGLTLVLNYDRRRFGPADADALLQSLVDRLVALLPVELRAAVPRTVA